MAENLKDNILLTDYYEFSMANGYYLKGELAEKPVIFDYFFRKNPYNGGYAIVAGIERFLDILSNFKFENDHIEYLKNYPLSPEFLEYLAKMKLKINVYGFQEGSVVFANEPILEIEGPLIQCQIIETFLLNSLNYATLVATKANRMWLASGKQYILEFGARRAQGPFGANIATYASLVGGCSGTSNVLAAKNLGIKASGTIAHSWIMSFPTEFEAFMTYADIYPDNTVLLVDTYDTLTSGIPNAIKVGKELRKRGYDLKGIRLDSGDLVKLSNEARKLLDEEGFINTKILISNDVDEYFIEDFKKKGGKCDIWGIGTRLVTAYDEPALTGVYKLAEFDKSPKVKVSNCFEKTTLPAKKRVVRFYDIPYNNNSTPQKKMVGDVIFNDTEIKIKKEGLINGKMTYTTNLFNLQSDEFDKVENIEYSGYESMLKLLFHNGKRVKQKLSWQDAQKNMEQSIEQLRAEHKRIIHPTQYPILISENLSKLRTETIKKYIK